MKFNKTIEKKIDKLFRPYERPGSPGCAVGITHQGEFLYKKGFGYANLAHNSPITPTTVFDVGSMAKQFTGFAVALLEQAGQLSIQEPVRAYLLDFPEYAGAITIADLLYHTSGIRNYTVLAYYMLGCHENDAVTSEEVYNLLRDLPSLSFTPGERWEYNDSNYFLLGRIVERVSGLSLGAFTREKIITPLDMRHTLFREYAAQVIPNQALSYVHYPIAFRSPCEYRRPDEISEQYYAYVSGYEHTGAEGLFTTVEDLTRWDRNFRDNHLGQGGSALIDRMLVSGTLRNGQPLNYGYGINVTTWKGKRCIGHDGATQAFTSTLFHFPDEDATLICLSNQSEVSATSYKNQIMDLVFPDCLPTGPALLPPKRAVPEREIRKLAGAYLNPETSSIWEIIPKDGTLVIKVNRSAEIVLARVRPLEYRPANPQVNLTLRILLDPHGQVDRLEGAQDGIPFTFFPFHRKPLKPKKLARYAGGYTCQDLKTTFRVSVQSDSLVLKNHNRHFCSMDLAYTPALKDFFVSFDPHPVISVIQFLRKKGKLTAFVYRDFEGDRREDFVFKKCRKRKTN